MTATLTNDQIVLFRGVKRSMGTSKKGEPKERFELYLDSAQAAILAQSTTTQLGSPRGVKVDLHIVKKPSEHGGTFDSAFCFIKAVQEQQSTEKPVNTPSAVSTGTVSDKTAATIDKLKTKVA